MAGRITKLDDERSRKIVALISAGNYSETAAKASGISTATFYGWMAEGRAAREKTKRLNAREKSCLNFLEAVEKGRAEAEARSVAIITRAAIDGTWTAAAWYLERTSPARYGRRVETTVEVKDSKSAKDMSEEELLQYLREHGLDG
jgi:hypothetical protein